METKIYHRQKAEKAREDQDLENRIDHVGALGGENEEERFRPRSSL